MIFLPLSILLLVLFVLLLPLFFFLIQVEIFRAGLSKLGLSPAWALLVVFLSLAGSMINIPLSSREASLVPPQQDLAGFFSSFGRPDPGTRQVIAINVGGCVIPLLLCLYLLPKAPPLPTFFATVVSTLICFRLSRVTPGGIMIPAFIPPLVAAAMAFIFTSTSRIPVAYISGVLGVLIGADLLNLRAIGNYPGVLSIGGAGVYDGIFLVGIVSALLSR